MAKNNNKATSPKRQALSDAQVKQALKFAKSRGLTKIDLRKKLNPQRRRIAERYFEASESPKLYTTITIKDRKAVKAYKHGAQLTEYSRVEGAAYDKVLIKKERSTDTIRVLKDKRGRPTKIKLTNPRSGTTKTIKIRSGIPSKRKSERYAIPLGASTKTFENEELLREFMTPYEREQGGKYNNWEQYVEVTSSDEDEEL